MQFPESWLREFCNPALSTQELADVLTMGGFEVEDIQTVAKPFSGVVVGEILETVQHPDADRLRICTVDVGSAGDGQPLSIVCGAPNARAGIKVPCAMVGAELPAGENGRPFKIKLGKLRGVASHGMLCSARELTLADESAGILELPANAQAGTDIRDFLRLDDALLTLKLTPNLAHGLSISGIARELSALTGASLTTPVIASVAANCDARVPVDIAASDLCGRFCGRVIRSINPAATTPAWMVERLARCGQRSISPLVDISNYVMFEYGQPSHIFDLDKISGDLEVRWARNGEQLKLLNGNTVTLDEGVGVIADGNAVESLAGIMGGDATAVGDDTRNIYIEAAFWWPAAIQGRSRRFNFSTEAGHRFERGVDPARCAEMVEHITRLVLDICGTADTAIGPLDDTTVALPARPCVDLRVSRAAKVIGMPVGVEQCRQVLQRLQLPFEELAEERDTILRVTPPSYRFDIAIEEDLIEEVVRVIGFNRIPETPPQATMAVRLPPEQLRDKFATRRLLADLGYQETINYSFVEESWETQLAGNSQPIRLLNPIAAPMSVMRSSLFGSLLKALKFNLDRKAARVRLFEVGRVFLRDPSVPTSATTIQGVHQPMRVAGLAYGDPAGLQWGSRERRVDFYDVKGDIESLFAPLAVRFEAAEHPALHPGRSARVILRGQPIGFVGELHPKWRQQWEFSHPPILFELDWQAVLLRQIPSARPVSRYQMIERDIAIVVKESVAFAEVEAAMARAGKGALKLVQTLLFDIFRPGAGQPGGAIAADEKSLAIRLTLDSGGSAVTDGDIDAAVSAVVDALKTRVGARLRS